MAPRVGLEPTTTRLTAECSTIELSGINLYKIRTWQRPTLPGTCVPSTIGAGELNFCVRNGYRWGLSAIITRKMYSVGNGWSVGQLVRKKPLPTINYLEQSTTVLSKLHSEQILCLESILRSSPRPISTGQLRTLLPFHTRPIYQFVFLGSYQLSLWEILS